MLRIFVIAFCLTSLSTISVAQINSVQDGDWDDPDTWDCACVPDEFSGPIQIVSGTTVTLDFAVGAEYLEIESGGTLNVTNSGSLFFPDFFFSDVFVIDGFLDNSGIITAGFFSNISINGTLIARQGSTIDNVSVDNLFFNSGSTYNHNFTTSAGSIPEATWDNNSTCLISGYTTNNLPPSNLNQAFGNFEWNTPNFSVASPNNFVNLGGNLTSVNGNLVVQSTGLSGRQLRFVNGDPGYFLTISGNLVFNGGVTVLSFNGSSVSTINVGGSFILAGGNCVMTQTAGDIVVNLSGNFSRTSGTLAKSGTGNSNLIFNGTGIQNYSYTGTPVISSAINYSVANGATLDLGLSALTGSGSFTANSGATVRVGSIDAAGAIQDGTTNGNIRTPTLSRSYASGVTIIYNGTSAQFLGTGHPSSSGVNTVINNSNGVSLAASVTIGGNLTLTSGNLNVGNNTLTLGGAVTPNSNFIAVTSGSSLAVNGSGAFGTFPFPVGDQTITNFTLNRSSGSVTFNRNVTITGATTLSNGNLIFNNQTLTLNGTFSSGGGALSSNSSSTLTIGGTGAFGELAFAVGGNTLNTLNFSRSSGSASIDNSLTITSALNLQDGDFTNTTGLSLANNATVTRNSTAQFLGSPIAQGGGEFYNVIYTGSGLSTGVELPTTGDDNLDNLTINGGPVSLTQNIIVNGDLILQNSSLNGNGFNITMAGSPGVWNRQSGSFTPGSGTVFIAGNISVQASSSAPQYGNLTINSGATFTARSGNMNINGNLQIDAASTFNHNSGTLTFNGSSTQGLAGAGKTFNNITVNKTGGNLQLTSTVNLLNTLTVQSATTVESGGSLRLLSTSDGTTGNARIASLPAGASVTGNVTVQRFIADEGRIYRYISAPVSGYTVAQLQSEFPVTGSFTTSSSCSGCTTNPSMFAYDESVAGVVDNGYTQFPVSSNTETLQVGRGYAPFVRDDVIPGNVNIDWIGSVNQGSIALPVTFTNSGDASADGYNLVGNPFPSSIDWDNVSGWTKTNISPVITVRDNGAGGVYRTWDGAVGDFNSGAIATGQAFWVRAIGSSPALVVNEQAKTTETATLYRQKETEPLDYLKISLTQGNITDNTYLRYRPEALNVLDEFDGPKLNNASFDTYTFSEDNIPMAINAVNAIACGQSLKLGIKDMPNGTFTFSREALGFFEYFDIFLNDSFMGSTVKLTSDTNYEFVTSDDPASKAEDRFSFELKIALPVKLHAVDGTLYSNYESGNQWYRNGQLIEGVTGSSFTPENPGLYTLKVKIGTCEFGAPESYVITGLEGHGKKSIRVFPNPVKNKVTIEVDSQIPVSVRLMNSLGVEVESRLLTGNGFVKQSEFDLSGQSNGMYILHVLKEGRVHQVKIIKTNE